MTRFSFPPGNRAKGRTVADERRDAQHYAAAAELVARACPDAEVEALWANGPRVFVLYGTEALDRATGVAFEASRGDTLLGGGGLVVLPYFILKEGEVEVRVYTPGSRAAGPPLALNVIERLRRVEPAAYAMLVDAAREEAGG